MWSVLDCASFKFGYAIVEKRSTFFFHLIWDQEGCLGMAI